MYLENEQSSTTLQGGFTIRCSEWPPFSSYYTVVSLLPVVTDIVHIQCLFGETSDSNIAAYFQAYPSILTTFNSVS